MEPKDPGCKIWDWDEQICLECSYRWVFIENGTCKQVSDECDGFDGQGNCLSCYKGYWLENGECKTSENDFCLIRREDGGCSECYPGYILSQGVCYYGNPLCERYT